MASPVRSVLPRLEPAAALTDDDLLQEIFLRIASPADLARTSTACVSFRRLIADPSFLRRYHSTHPPLLLGFLYDGYCRQKIFKPVQAPHPNAPAARALASALNFSFLRYLPPARWQSWIIQDVRDGRVLFSSDRGRALPDLAVCDPVTRGSLLLPPIPEDFVRGHTLEVVDAVFAPSADVNDYTSFRVMGAVYCVTKLLVFLFNSTSSSWSVCTSSSWDTLSLSGRPMFESPCYACGCFYWKFHWANKLSMPNMNRNRLLKLDMTTMEFSTVDLLPDLDERCVLVVEAGEGGIGIFSHKKQDTYLNYHSSMQNVSQRANQWQVKNIIPVPVRDDLAMTRASEGYIFLLGDPSAKDTIVMTCFSLEVKSLKVERVTQVKFSEVRGFPYFGFPPSLSLGRI